MGEPSTFPLPWERVSIRTRRYAVSDLRLVFLRSGAVQAEVALYDLATICVPRTVIERITGIGTLVVSSTRLPSRTIRVRGVPGARQRALNLNLLVADLRGSPPGDDITSQPLPSLWRLRTPGAKQAALIAPGLLLLLVALIIVVSLRGPGTEAAPAANDPIRPNGIKRTREEIADFMKTDVMPFARRALEPIVGAGELRCETCHGDDAEAREWQMPAVAALPEPAVNRLAASVGSDSQVRNALHGYLAEGENQRTAGHMRAVVLPGMAAVLRRPAYDFTRSYEYNRQRGAFGCYHCHVVNAAATIDGPAAGEAANPTTSPAIPQRDDYVRRRR